MYVDEEALCRCVSYLVGGHCAVVVNQMIYIFGGRTKSKSIACRDLSVNLLKELGKDEYLNDLYCFNPSMAFSFCDAYTKALSCGARVPRLARRHWVVPWPR